MSSNVRSSLIALGLLMACGCALTDRTISRSDDFRFRTKDSTKSKSDLKPKDQLTFKAPPRTRNSERESTDVGGGDSRKRTSELEPTSRSVIADASELSPGHSYDQTVGIGAVGKSSVNPPPRLSDSRNGLSTDELNLASGTLRDRSEFPRSNPAVQAIDPSGPEMSSNPVQLQGLEVEDEPTSPQIDAVRQPNGNESLANGIDGNLRDASGRSPIQLWADRPSDRVSGTVIRTRVPTLEEAATVKAGTQGDSRQASANPNVGLELPPLPWQVELDQLIARIELILAQSKPDGSGQSQSEGTTDPRSEYLRKQAQLRMLYLMAQRQQDALSAIPGVEPSQQEYWQQMIWALSNSFDTVQFPDSSIRAVHAAAPLGAALRQLREVSPLLIKNMTFCRKISSFGNYERFPRNEFTPGQSEVLLYTEIENFESAPTIDGEYRTSLKSLIEIVNSKGKVVWTKGFKPTEDFCRNPRRDYFHNYQFHIPKDLSTGDYSLKLTIADELSHKRVSNSLNFVLK